MTCKEVRPFFIARPVARPTSASEVVLYGSVTLYAAFCHVVVLAWVVSHGLTVGNTRLVGEKW